MDEATAYYRVIVVGCGMELLVVDCSMLKQIKRSPTQSLMASDKLI